MSRPLVLVSLGTHDQPFDRLVGWIEEWSANRDVEVVLQHGVSRPMVGATNAPLLAPEEFRALLESAAVIVSHGGTGTVMDARRSGRRIVVVPRRACYGEHVDDHQVACTARLEDVGLIHRATDQAELVDLLDGALDGRVDTWLHTAEEAPGVAEVSHVLSEPCGRPRSRVRRIRTALRAHA